MADNLLLENKTKMAKNETKVTESTTAVTEMESTANIAKTELTEVVAKTLYVERKRYKSNTNGKMYWSYIVKCKLRGKDYEIDFVAKDKGGYEVLDLVFDVKPTAELLMREEKSYDEKTGLKKFIIYEVQNIDEDGNVWSCGIKPSRDSDKSLLKNLLNLKEPTAVA